MACAQERGSSSSRPAARRCRRLCRDRRGHAAGDHEALPRPRRAGTACRRGCRRSARSRGCIVARVDACLRRSTASDEAQPLDAVVVLVAVEMLAEEHAQAAPQRPSDQRQQHERGRRRRTRPDRRAPRCRRMAQISSRRTPSAADTRRRHERRRVEHDLARDEDVQRPLRLASHGDAISGASKHDERRARPSDPPSMPRSSSACEYRNRS